MEVEKMLAEQKEKSKEKKQIQDILSSDKKIWAVVQNELQEIDDKFGDKRRTKIKTIELVEYNPEDFIEHEDAYLVISKNGWLRKFKTVVEPNTLKYKENDSLLSTVKANTREFVAFFTSRGMVYVFKLYNLPYTRTGFGEPIQNLFKFSDGEKVVSVLSLDPAELTATTKILTEKSSKKSGRQTRLNFTDEKNGGLEGMVVGSSGYGFRFTLTSLIETTRSGRKLMTLKSDDKLIGVSLLTGDHLFMASISGKGIVIPVEQVTLLTGAGMGSRLMKITNSSLAGFKVANKNGHSTITLEDETTKRINIKDIRVTNRGGQGVIISKRKKITAIE
jgi:DNA gyrase subunit A